MLSVSRNSAITPCQYYAYEPIICSFTEMWDCICSAGYGASLRLSGRARGNYLGAYILTLCAWVIIGRSSGEHESCYCLAWMNKQSDEMGLLTDGTRTTLMSMHRSALALKPIKSITPRFLTPTPCSSLNHKTINYRGKYCICVYAPSFIGWDTIYHQVFCRWLHPPLGSCGRY